MTPLQPAQPAVRARAASVRARRAPHVGQYTDPSNMAAKQAGQLTVVSVARQYLQLWSPDAAAVS
jgi:hypothetical protein